MAWTTPKTDFSPGNVLTADQMNAIGNNLTALYTSAQRLDRQTKTSAVNAVASLATAGNVFTSNLTFTSDGVSLYRVEFFCGSVQATTAGSALTVYLTNGSTTAITRLGQVYNASAVTYASMFAVHYVTPAAGSVTYNVKAVANGILQGGSGSGDNFPVMFVQVFGPDMT